MRNTLAISAVLLLASSLHASELTGIRASDVSAAVTASEGSYAPVKASAASFVPPCKPEGGSAWCSAPSLDAALATMPKATLTGISGGMRTLVDGITGQFLKTGRTEKDSVVIKEAEAMAKAAKGLDGMKLLRSMISPDALLTVDFSGQSYAYSFHLSYSAKVGPKKPFLSDSVREHLAAKYSLFCDGPELVVTVDQNGALQDVQTDLLGCIAD